MRVTVSRFALPALTAIVLLSLLCGCVLPVRWQPPNTPASIAGATTTPTPTSTPLPSATATITFTPTLTLTPTASLTPSLTLTPLLSRTASPPATRTRTTTATFTQTRTPTTTRTRTISPTVTLTPTLTPLLPLRTLAARRNFFIGSAVFASRLASDPQYAEVVQHEFNLLTPENEMKMHKVWVDRRIYDFGGADALADFARQNGMRLRGHTLLWNESNPPWLTGAQVTSEEATVLLYDYIKALVGRYRGQVIAWDVANETVDRPTIWEKLIGPQAVELAFRWAHEADPQAKLYYNDFGAEASGAKADRVYDFVKGLLAKGVPVHGVGLQMHVNLVEFRPVASLVAENIARLNALGLEVQITEMDVPNFNTAKAPDLEKQQALIYGEMLRTCLAAKKCTAFVTWGFTDRYTWYTTFLKKPGATPLFFDENYQPKAAYHALAQALWAASP